METKKCTKCSEVKELGEFKKIKLKHDGRGTICKKCINISNYLWNDLNKDIIKISKKKYYEKTKKNIKSYNNAYYLLNKDKILDVSKVWAKKNNFKIKEISKKRYLLNRDKINNDSNTRYRQSIKSLGDRYLKKQLKAKNIPITTETIELKRKQLNIHRTIKKLQDETN